MSLSFKGSDRFSSQYIERIGQGTQATIDKHFYQNQFVAIKNYKEIDAALLRELYVFQRLKNCTNINQMLDIDISLKGIRIMMHYYTSDLQVYIENTPLSTRTIRGPKIFDQLLNALYHLHSRNIIHHDIKTENILIDNDTVVLADFGLASECLSPKFIRGSYAYRAPELLTKNHYNDKIDIWSLGVTIIEYYLGEYITDPSDELHHQYPEEFSKMVSLQILSLITNPNKNDLTIDKQHDHIDVKQLLPNISNYIVEKLITMVQLNPHDRSSITDLYKGTICPIVNEILRKGPMLNYYDKYYEVIYKIIDFCEELGLSPTTCYLSITLLERLLANYKISNLRVYGVACLLLINKLQENYDISINNMGKYFQIEKNELIFSEYSILKKMNYMLMEEDEFSQTLEKLIDDHYDKYIMVNQYEYINDTVDTKLIDVNSKIIYPLLLNMYKKLEKGNLYPGEMYDFELIDYI